ncbi:hypothetical protein [Gracilimonas mengyeensis]|uniref:Ribbon-helix-helix protein, copG family n=1 Tax=Gracilimonas mengyeensis TaxID=1302730 RepID=A0A521F6T1_9BACT|nr:hypothetical protein [Gracilimonas mengyeensis]SMO91210.1 hypothetical protein SAMN06265219_11551 [Gracilimonas mengyeensis]
MKTISFQIDEKTLVETEKILSQKNTSRNKYISEAIRAYNSKQKREDLKQQLKNESKLVKEESLTVLKEFETIED